MVRLLKSGRLPAERQASVVNLICQRGNEEDLAYVYEQAVKPDGFSGEIRCQAIEGLATAAKMRKIQPKVDASGLVRLLSDPDEQTARSAVRLASAWKTKELAGPFAGHVVDPRASDESRRLALERCCRSAANRCEATDKLLASDNSRLHAYGVVALAHADLEAAAARAARLLVDPGMSANLDLLLVAFLDRQGERKTGRGPGQNGDSARHGQAGAAAALSRWAKRFGTGRRVDAAAGLHLESAPPTPDELKRLSAEALAQGDPARGEAIFRRADLGCLKCHAVSGAGGDVGPDLSPVGGPRRWITC